MERSGFFDADNGDREYDSADFVDYFTAMMPNGVFDEPTGQLKVSPGDGLNLNVSAGRAFINGRWYTNDDVLSVPINVNSTASTRYDAVCVTLDLRERKMSVTVRENVGMNVTPRKEGEQIDLILAVVSVQSGASSISQTDIRDTRSDSSLCVLVHKPSTDREAITKMVSAVYPVGSVMILMNNSNPADLLGFGTWQKISDGKFLRSASSNFGSGGGADSVSYTPKGSVSTPYNNLRLSTGYLYLGYGNTIGYLANSGDSTKGVGTVSSANGSASGTFTGTAQDISTIPSYLNCAMWQRIA